MTRYASLRCQVIAALGGECTRCHLREYHALCIDHVWSDGAEERAERRGIAYLQHILEHIHSGRYQILCASCNAIKAHELREGRKTRLRLDTITDLASCFYDEQDSS